MSSRLSVIGCIRAALLCLAVLSPLPSFAAPFAYITSLSGGGLTVIDTANNSIVTTINDSAGGGDLGVAVSPDGRRVYVTDGIGVEAIDTASNTVVATARLGLIMFSVAVTPDSSRVYAMDSNAGVVYAFNASNLAQIASTPLGAPGGGGMVVSPDGSVVYVGGPSNISVISTANNTRIASIPIAPNIGGIQGVALSADGTRLFAGISGGKIAVINTVTATVMTYLNISFNSSPYGLALTPDGSKLYAANFAAGSVSVIDAVNYAIIGSPIPINGGPLGVSITPDGSKVYVATENPGGVVVISTATNTISTVIPLNQVPLAFGSFIGGSGSSTPSQQTINFGTAPSIIAGGTGILTATASSGLPLTFSSLSTSDCSVSGSSANSATVTGINAGVCVIQAQQTGNSSYAFTIASLLFQIGPGAAQTTQSISYGHSLSGGSSIAVGGTGTITATASSGLPVTVSSATSSVCSVANGIITGLGVGTCDIRMTQAGNTTYAATQTDFTFAVTAATTTATLVSNINPSAAAQPVTFTFTLAGSSPFSSPVSGTVQLLDAGSQIASVQIGATGTAVFTVSLASGIHNVTGSYSGDGSHAASSSNTVRQIVGLPTTTTLTSSANPSKPGQSVTLTATVTGTAFSNSVTGTVAFNDGSTLLGNATLSGGTATLTLSTLTNGPHLITATYSGDGNNAMSTSAILTQRVLAATTVTVTSSQNPSAIGQNVTFTITVTGAQPTGVIYLMDGASSFGSVPLNAGVGTYSLSGLSPGDHPMSASYPGDSNNAAATSQTFTQSVGSITPQSGYWWNPAEPGRGFVIEVQDSTLFMAGFLYDPTGRASWVGSTGQMASSTQYTGALVTYSGGQSLTGAYKTPAVSPSLGTISITFSSSSQGTLTWPGGTIPIQRFDIVAGGSSAAQPAGTPQAGWWWNANEGGRGFALEVQGGQMYLAGYMYDTSGNPVWYLSSAPMANSAAYQGAWQLYGGGETLTGPYQAPVLVNANAGSVTVQFTSASTATLTLPNGIQIPLTRYHFAQPVNPIPSSLWQPAQGATPASGNYVYLQSDTGDYIGQGQTNTYTGSALAVTGSSGLLAVTVNGPGGWTGDFVTMNSLPLQTGYYPNLQRYPFNDPGAGGLSWYGEGRGCNTLSGWFAIDNISSSGGNVTSIDLRFEQHCEGGTTALHGKMHWSQ